MRAFGVSLGGLTDASAFIPPENVYRLSQEVFKGSGDLQNPYGSIIKMLLLDFVAFGVTSEKKTATVPVQFDRPVGGRTAGVSTVGHLLLCISLIVDQFYLDLVGDWRTKLRRRVQAVTRTPEGQAHLAQEEEEPDIEMEEFVAHEEEEEGDDGGRASSALWTPELKDYAASRLALLVKYDSLIDIGPVVTNIILAAHALDYLLQVRA